MSPSPRSPKTKTPRRRPNVTPRGTEANQQDSEAQQARTGYRGRRLCMPLAVSAVPAAQPKAAPVPLAVDARLLLKERGYFRGLPGRFIGVVLHPDRRFAAGWFSTSVEAIRYILESRLPWENGFIWDKARNRLELVPPSEATVAR